jgi:hypothetical protein
VSEPIRAAKLRGARGGNFKPGAPDVIDIDVIDEPKGVPYIGRDPVPHTAKFNEIDRSAEARVIQISVPRV